jgi:hypothetical protein
MIWDPILMKEALIEMNVDVERAPLGHLKKEYMARAYKVLSDIEKIVLSGSTGKEHHIN